MKLIDILHEMEEEDGKKGLKRAEYDLTIQTDEIQPAIDALNNIENYGIYAQNLRDPETIKKVFGPSIPAQKAGAAWKHWDTSSPLEKEEKLADIQKRHPQEFEAGMKEAEKGFEKWKEEGNDGSIEEYLYSLNGKSLPKGIVGKFGKHYYPQSNSDNLKKYAGRLEQGIHYMINGDEIKFPQSESPYKTRAYLEKVIKTIMDNGDIDYKILKVEPTVSDKNIEPTRAPKEDTVSFKVTIDPTKLKGQRKEFNSLIQRLKNTYDKNFTYEGGVVNIAKVKNQMAKIDLIKLFAPFAKKAEAPMNEETLRMQKLAGIITEEEIQVILKEGVDKYLGKYRAPNGDLFNKYVNDENDVYIKDKKTGWNSIDLEIEGEVRSWEDIKADIKAANTRMSVKDFRASMGVYR